MANQSQTGGLHRAALDERQLNRRQTAGLAAIVPQTGRLMGFRNLGIQPAEPEKTAMSHTPMGNGLQRQVISV
jgi:hypothetical protein